MIDALDIDFHFLFLAFRDRIEKTDPLDVAAIASIALIGDDDVIEGTLFRPTTGQADADHFSNLASKKIGRRAMGLPSPIGIID